ncbi:MAG: exonuclease domain-containing protein [Patulibacter sp.]
MTASWVAIDFETATQSRASACAIGIVTVEDGVVVAEREILIQPPGNEYDGFNIAIHGITPEDTAYAPTFAEVWPEIERAIDGRLVLAHNAGFDLSVLRHASRS